MVRIRLRRVGSKKQPSYRIVVTDKRNPRDGRFIEIIGHHNPRTEPSTDVVDEARALYWLGVGAQPSDAVQRIMKRTGTWERFERLRQGEEVENLVEEAGAVDSEVSISPKTRFPAPGAGESKQKAQEAEAVTAVQNEVEAEVETEAKSQDEVEAEVEIEAEAEPEAEDEAETEDQGEVEAEAEDT